MAMATGIEAAALVGTISLLELYSYDALGRFWAAVVALGAEGCWRRAGSDRMDPSCCSPAAARPGPRPAPQTWPRQPAHPAQQQPAHPAQPRPPPGEHQGAEQEQGP